MLPTDFLENIFPKNLMFSIEILNFKKGLSGVYPSNTFGLNSLGYLDYFLIVFNRYWQLWPQRLAMAMEKVCSVGSTLRLFWMTQLNYTFYSDLKTTDLNGLGGRLRSFEVIWGCFIINSCLTFLKGLDYILIDFMGLWALTTFNDLRCWPCGPCTKRRSAPWV